MEAINTLMTGFVYRIDDIDLDDVKDFKSEVEKIFEQRNHYLELNRGNYFPTKNAPEKEPNETIIFDIKGHIEGHAVKDASFRGFLYNDGRINGKITYAAGRAVADERLKGKYEKLDKTTIVIFGKWLLPKNDSFLFCIILSNDWQKVD